MQTPTAPQQHPPPLRAVREAHGLGLREVARFAGVDAAHLSRVERGEARVSLDALLRLSRVLGLRELERFLEPYAPPAVPLNDNDPAITPGRVEVSAGQGRHGQS